MDEEIVKELIQDDMTKDSIQKELDRLLHDKNYRNKMIGSFRELRQKLGDKGASVKVAGAMYNRLKS
jgi:lipid-A-disaccharide synthase